MLSLAVTTSAFAGVKVNAQKALLQQNSRTTKVTKAPALAYNQNVQTMNIDVPRVQLPQHEVVPGLRLLDRNSATRAIVTEQPAGTVVYYKRTAGTAVWPGLDESPYVTNGNMSGFVMAVEDGNTVWFKNLLYDAGKAFGTYWIKGTKNSAGTQITIAKGQDMGYSSQYDAYVRLGTASLTATTVSDTYPYGYRMRNLSTSGNITFTISNGVLIHQGSQSGAAGAGTNGLVAYWSDDNTWYPVANFATQLTPAGDIPDAPVLYTDADIDLMDGEEVSYYRTGWAWQRIYEDGVYQGLGIDEQGGYGHIFYDADGVTVYMRDPVYGASIFSDVVGHWIKGTKDGNTLSFPVNQYISWDEEFYGVKVNYGLLEEVEEEVDGVVGTYIHYTPMDEVTEVTFTIDEAAGTITMNDCGYIDDEMTQFVGFGAQLDSAYQDARFLGAMDFYTVYYEIPGTPTEVTVQEGSTTANVSWTPGTANSKWNVRYREWVDPATVEYFFDDFEAEILEGYSGWDMDGDGHWWGRYLLNDGNTAWLSFSYDNDTQKPLNPDNWLVSPEVTLDGVVRVTAWGYQAEYSNEVFGVYIFVGDTANITNPETDFIQLGDDVTTNADHTEYTFAIPEEYWGQQGYVAIVHHNVSDVFILCVDDLYVGNPDGGNPWTYVYDVEDPATVLTGLTPDTDYEVQVQGANEGGLGMWSDIVPFHTLVDQPQPTVLRGDVDESGEVDLDDLATLINFLLTDNYDLINYDNAAICDEPNNDVVDMNDLTALINYLLTDQWAN